MSSSTPLDGRTYYHGTSPSSAICISIEGFRLLDERVRNWDGLLGIGIYVTRNLGQSLWFGEISNLQHPYVLLVELAPGTKIARLDDSPEPRMLDSLRREFGHEILGPDFVRAIPKNKHLQPRELFALMGHLAAKDQLYELKTLRHVRRWLQRLGYHGFGHTQKRLGRDDL